jgi:hypothetical protein
MVIPSHAHREVDERGLGLDLGGVVRVGELGVQEQPEVRMELHLSAMALDHDMSLRMFVDGMLRPDSLLVLYGLLSALTASWICQVTGAVTAERALGGKILTSLSPILRNIFFPRLIPAR